MMDEIIDFRGVSIEFLEDELERARNDPPAQLYVVTRKLEAQPCRRSKVGGEIQSEGADDGENCVMPGTTLRLIRVLKDGTLEGEISRTLRRVRFCENQDARPKPVDEWTVEDFAETVVLPMTRQMPEGEQFFLRAAPPEAVGKDFQGTFVSQARGCKFSELVSALKAHFAHADFAQTHVWLDLFGANQPLLTSGGSVAPEVLAAREDALTKGLHEAIASFDAFVIFFDRWDTPAPLKRAWCVWEVLGALIGDKPIQVVYALGQEDAFADELTRDASEITTIMAANFDMRGAQCFKPVDKHMIDAAIERTLPGGFVQLNSVMTDQVRVWIKAMAHEHLEKVRARVRVAVSDGAGDQAEADDAGADEEGSGTSPYIYQSNGEPGVLVRTLCSVGQLENTYGRSDLALPLYEEALSRATGSERAIVMSGLGAVFAAQGRYDDAINVYREGLALAHDHGAYKAVGSLTSSLTAIFALLQRPNEALPVLETSVAILRDTPPPDDSTLCTAIFNLATFYEQLGWHLKARKLYVELLPIQESALGPRHTEIAGLLHSIGVTLESCGQFAEAEDYYTRAKDIQVEMLGERSFEVAKTLHNLGHLRSKQGKLDSALDLFQESLAIKRFALGPVHPSVALTLGGCAEIYLRRRNPAKALETFQEVLAIFEATDGPKSVQAARTRQSIGVVYRKLGDLKQAKEEFTTALGIFVQVLGKNSSQANTAWFALQGCRFQAGVSSFVSMVNPWRRSAPDRSSS